MKKFSLLTITLVVLTAPGFSQKVSGKLNLKKKGNRLKSPPKPNHS